MSAPAYNTPDVAFGRFLQGTFKDIMKKKCEDVGRKVLIFEIPELMEQAFSRAVVMQSAVSGFQKTGNYLVNRTATADYLHAF